MSNTRHSLYKLITGLFLLIGIGITCASTRSLFVAKVAGMTQIQVAADHSSVSNDNLSQLMVGMLLVLAGFSFHALYVVRNREPMHVHMVREGARKRRKSRS